MGTLIKCKPVGLIYFCQRMDLLITKNDDILILRKNYSKELLTYKLGLLENAPENKEALKEQIELVEKTIETTDDDYAVICNDQFYKVDDVSLVSVYSVDLSKTNELMDIISNG
tara:strand:+ start:15675 stop:16016 length:342 start_codon:yes stop_codon:yes gene_type:complete